MTPPLGCKTGHLLRSAVMTRPAILLGTLVLLSLSCNRKPHEVVRSGGGEAEVTFFDVGEGDAALIRTPEHATVLIDSGHNGEIVSLLRSKGVSRIDLLIISHSHADHTGGLSALAREFPVTEIWYSGGFHRKVQQVVEQLGSPEPVVAGKTKVLGQLSLIVLHPEIYASSERRAESNVNNRSLVVKVTYGGTRYLFPGDCELGCWEEMFELHRSELRATVLKAAHHGSWNGTNSGVLGSVRPEVVVISCGRENRYGHPHPTVLKMIAKLGAELLRTDKQGTIECEGARCAPIN